MFGVGCCCLGVGSVMGSWLVWLVVVFGGCYVGLFV